MNIWKSHCVWNAEAQVGEAPTWDPVNKLLYWFDIPSKLFYIYEPSSDRKHTLDLEHETACLGLTNNGDLIAGTREGFARLHQTSGELSLLTNPEPDVASRFNDGKVGPDGRFYAGTISDAREPECAFYRLDPDGSTSKLFDGVTNSNGLAWSLDHKTLYYIDTPTRKVDAFDFDASTGTLSNRRIAFEVAEALGGKPDGMTIDAEGCLWIAHFGGAKVTRWNPDTGECIGRVSVPARDVTCPTFGGEKLDTLYITTARIKMEDTDLMQQPFAGGLFSAKVGVSGVEPFVFKG